MASGSEPRLALATCAEVPELDPEGQLLLRSCREAGIEAEATIWNDPGIAWDRFDRVLIRSTWDYQNRPGEFAEWAARIGARLINPPEIVRWNVSKRYLETIAAWGFATVATSFLTEPGAEQLPGSGEFVLKPTVSAGSKDTARYVAESEVDRRRAGEHLAAIVGSGREAMVQPFLASVEDVAETAVVLLGGEPTHAMRKGPLLERDQELEQGLFRPEQMESRRAAPDELELAAGLVRRFAAEIAMPLYARVDLLRDVGGEPVVLELELIEPSLFLEWDEAATARLVDLLGGELAQPLPR